MYILKVCTTGVRSTLTDTYWVNVRMVIFLLCMTLIPQHYYKIFFLST